MADDDRERALEIFSQHDRDGHKRVCLFMSERQVFLFPDDPAQAKLSTTSKTMHSLRGFVKPFGPEFWSYADAIQFAGLTPIRSRVEKEYYADRAGWTPEDTLERLREYIRVHDLRVCKCVCDWGGSPFILEILKDVAPHLELFNLCLRPKIPNMNYVTHDSALAMMRHLNNPRLIFGKLKEAIFYTSTDDAGGGQLSLDMTQKQYPCLRRVLHDGNRQLQIQNKKIEFIEEPTLNLSYIGWAGDIRSKHRKMNDAFSKMISARVSRIMYPELVCKKCGRFQREPCYHNNG